MLQTLSVTDMSRPTSNQRTDMLQHQHPSQMNSEPLFKASTSYRKKPALVTLRAPASQPPNMLPKLWPSELETIDVVVDSQMLTSLPRSIVPPDNYASKFPEIPKTAAASSQRRQVANSYSTQRTRTYPSFSPLPPNLSSASESTEQSADSFSTLSTSSNQSNGAYKRHGYPSANGLSPFSAFKGQEDMWDGGTSSDDDLEVQVSLRHGSAPLFPTSSMQQKQQYSSITPSSKLNPLPESNRLEVPDSPLRGSTPRSDYIERPVPIRSFKLDAIPAHLRSGTRTPHDETTDVAPISPTKSVGSGKSLRSTPRFPQSVTNSPATMAPSPGLCHSSSSSSSHSSRDPNSRESVRKSRHGSASSTGHKEEGHHKRHPSRHHRRKEEITEVVPTIELAPAKADATRQMSGPVSPEELARLIQVKLLAVVRERDAAALSVEAPPPPSPSPVPGYNNNVY
mmetsp:Transcript_32648/g.52942  ORF Transcript_32648/g.52942 Transcript_32648/m.52942 type:complete len:454 (+) Transcript_32648:69-1430(+)